MHITSNLIAALCHVSHVSPHSRARRPQCHGPQAHKSWRARSMPHNCALGQRPFAATATLSQGGCAEVTRRWVGRCNYQKVVTRFNYTQSTARITLCCRLCPHGYIESNRILYIKIWKFVCSFFRLFSLVIRRKSFLCIRISILHSVECTLA